MVSGDRSPGIDLHVGRTDLLHVGSIFGDRSSGIDLQGSILGPISRDRSSGIDLRIDLQGSIFGDRSSVEQWLADNHCDNISHCDNRCNNFDRALYSHRAIELYRCSTEIQLGHIKLSNT